MDYQYSDKRLYIMSLTGKADAIYLVLATLC